MLNLRPEKDLIFPKRCVPAFGKGGFLKMAQCPKPLTPLFRYRPKNSRLPGELLTSIPEACPAAFKAHLVHGISAKKPKEVNVVDLELGCSGPATAELGCPRGEWFQISFLCTWAILTPLVVIISVLWYSSLRPCRPYSDWEVKAPPQGVECRVRWGWDSDFAVVLVCWAQSHQWDDGVMYDTVMGV